MGSEKTCNNERVDALRGGWTITGIAKRKCKNKGLMP